MLRGFKHPHHMTPREAVEVIFEAWRADPDKVAWGDAETGFGADLLFLELAQAMLSSVDSAPTMSWIHHLSHLQFPRWKIDAAAFVAAESLTPPRRPVRAHESTSL